MDRDACCSFKPEDGSIHTFSLDGSKFSLVSVPPSQYICILGAAKVRILRGSVECLGATLSPKNGTNTIYSPKSSSLLTMRHVNSAPSMACNDATINGIAGTLKCSKDDCIILFEQLNEGIEKIQNTMAQFRSLFEEMEEPHKVLSLFESCALVLQPLPFISSIKILDSWNEASARIIQMADVVPKVLICGSRKIGKSTFSRFMANKLLGKYGTVVFLDLDVGQSEFTPAGFASLKVINNPILGPPFTHLCTPEYSIFVASSSPSNNPVFYFESCKELIDRYEEQYSGFAPLIINTMGWVTGLGFDLLQSIVHYAKPQFILPLSNEAKIPSFVHSIFADEITSFNIPVQKSYSPSLHHVATEFDGLDVTKSKFSPTDQRNLALLSYFAMEFDKDGPLVKYNFAHFTEKIPFHISWKALSLCIPFQSISKKHYLAAINASYVGLVSIEPFEPHPHHVTCINRQPLKKSIGAAIVRGIDFKNNSIYILTPVPLFLLASVNCLVKSNIEIPVNISTSVHFSLISLEFTWFRSSLYKFFDFRICWTG